MNPILCPMRGFGPYGFLVDFFEKIINVFIGHHELQVKYFHEAQVDGKLGISYCWGFFGNGVAGFSSLLVGFPLNMIFRFVQNIELIKTSTWVIMLSTPVPCLVIIDTGLPLLDDLIP